jgi:hypothetical protein
MATDNFKLPLSESYAQQSISNRIATGAADAVAAHFAHQTLIILTEIRIGIKC